MSQVDSSGVLFQATLDLESAADRFCNHQWSTSKPSSALGRQIRPARKEEMRSLSSPAKGFQSKLDPAEANIQDLLPILRRERPDMAAELSQRWEHANLTFQSLCEQCPEPNDEFVESNLREKLDDVVAEIQTEIELLHEQIDFLDETLRKESETNSDEEPELLLKLQQAESRLENEMSFLDGPDLEQLRVESRSLQADLEEARRSSQRSSSSEELDDVMAQLEKAQSTLNEIQSRNGLQVEQVDAVRQAVRSLIQRRFQANEPFAIALSVLHDNQGTMPLAEFKSKVGDLLKNQSQVVSLLYGLVGQGLIEIDRTVNQGIVRSCIQLIIHLASRCSKIAFLPHFSRRGKLSQGLIHPRGCSKSDDSTVGGIRDQFNNRDIYSHIENSFLSLIRRHKRTKS